MTTTIAIPASLEPLADALIAARQRKGTVAVAGLPVPANDDEAYAVQNVVAERLGWFSHSRPTAWKVGAPSRDAMPSAAWIQPRVVCASPAVFARDEFNRMIIEGEIAFRLREAPAAGASAGKVSEAIGELVVTIEVVDPRYANMDEAGPTLRLADQLLHGSLVVGTGIPWHGSFDWSGQVATVSRNGKVVVEKRGAHPLGDPTYLVGWLAAHAAQRGAPLEAGDIVTAGTWTGVYDAVAGDTIDVDFPGVGRATAVFE